MNVCGYPKSGNHLTQHILRAGKIESIQTHLPSQWDHVDLHILRDIRGIIPSAVCHFVLGRPEKDPEVIRPFCLAMATAMRADWKGLGFSGGWSDYVAYMVKKAVHTATFRDLVQRPRAALFPLVDIGEFAEERMSDERRILGHMDPEFAWTSKFKFRSGDPEGWRETLGPALTATITEMFLPGLEVLRQVRL